MLLSLLWGCSSSDDVEVITEHEDTPTEMPVVFHVIWYNANVETQNIREGHLPMLLDKVNALYAASGVDIPFRFKLATRDPQGELMAEPGVNRIKRAAYNIDSAKFLKSGKEEYKEMMWDPEKYINVFIFQFTEKAVLGHSQMPLLPAPYALDGVQQISGGDPDTYPYPHAVCINNRYIYDVAEGDGYYQSDVVSTLAHELGHFLGLYHAFNQRTDGADTNDDTDFCSDTEPYNRGKYENRLQVYLFQFQNPTYAIDSRQSEAYATHVMRTNSINGSEFRATNIMDYAVCDCSAFSPQQVERMRYVWQHALLLPGAKDWASASTTRSSDALLPDYAHAVSNAIE